MSLTFRNGPFPFSLITEDAAAALYTGNDTACRVEGVALSALCLLWWTARSYDYSCDISGTNMSSGVEVATFSLFGSGTVVLQDLSQGALTPPLSALPGERVIYRGGAPELSTSGPTISYPCAGLFQDSSGGTDDSPSLMVTGTLGQSVPFSEPVPLLNGAWTWFQSMIVSQDAGGFYTRVGAEIYFKTGRLKTSPTDLTVGTYGFAWSKGASLELQMNGTTLSLLPLYYFTNVGLEPSSTTGGKLTLDFNDFYEA